MGVGQLYIMAFTQCSRDLIPETKKYAVSCLVITSFDSQDLLELSM